MFSQEQLTIEYIADNKRFLLGKNELRCMDQKNGGKAVTLALNKLDPNYNYHYKFNLIYLLIGVLLFAKGILSILSDLTDLAIANHYISGDSGQAAFTVLAFFSLNAFAYFMYRTYQRRKQKQGYQFVFAGDNEIAIVIPHLKNDAAKSASFLQALTQRIRNATPSNETVLYLLEQYHLLTRVEWAQLDANMLKKANPEQSSSSNIIHFPNKKA